MSCVENLGINRCSFFAISCLVKESPSGVEGGGVVKRLRCGRVKVSLLCLLHEMSVWANIMSVWARATRSNIIHLFETIVSETGVIS